MPATDPVHLIESQLAFDLRSTWQARVLYACGGHMGAVIMSVLAHSYGEADGLQILLKIVFPGFTSITAPYYCSIAKINKAGQVVADVMSRDGVIVKNSKVFDSEVQMRDEFRRLADRLRLSDDDRIELFKCAQRWCPADQRLDPTFDPKDPDAKRLKH